MKKFFTLIVLAAMTLVANAQELSLAGLQSVEKIKAATNFTGTNSDWKIEDGTSGDGLPMTTWTLVTANATASITFKDVPVTITYTNKSANKVFFKTYEEYIQPNGTGAYYEVTCKVGQYVTFYPKSYDNDGTADVTGAEETSITIPNGSEDPVSVKATDTTVKFKVTAKFPITKIAITDEKPTTNINAISADEAAPAVIKTVSGIIKNGKKYNFAGQRVK